MNKLLLTSALVCAISSSALAQDHSHHHHMHMGDDQASAHHKHVSNVPASISGDHVHAKGGFMVSYNYMRMGMDGNRNGTNDLSPLEISGDFANNTGVGPATLRIVPTKMDMDMHMLGAMYGVSDRLTLMVMGNYVHKSMDLVTYAMMNADMELGRFSTRTEGFGDTKLAALYDLMPGADYNLVGKLGVSLPTGNIDEEAVILNPMNAYEKKRAPYAMQLGSGTYDLEPALTFTDMRGAYSWGGQYSGVIRTGRNSQGYTLGDQHKISVFGGYQLSKMVGLNMRLTGEYQGRIDGADDQINGPVQTADPDNYGGRFAEIGLGANFALPVDGHSISVEGSLPIYQDLNGPQMKRDYGVTARYRYAF